MSGNGVTPPVLGLRAGDFIEVRSEREILSTLDENGKLDGLPFMPEMLQYCGRTFRVFRRADKACDTVGDYTSRRMMDAVHLEDLRCDGGHHGGCQAGCLLYWKEAWVKPLTAGAAAGPASAESESDARPPTRRLTRMGVEALTTRPDPACKGERLFVCGVVSFFLDPYRVAAGGRAVRDGRPLVRDCSLGAVALADGRIAYANRRRIEVVTP